MNGSALLSETRRQRIELQAALTAFERALAGAASSRSWWSEVATQLGHVRGAFARHLAVTEGRSGLFAEVTTRAPRLEAAVRQLRAEHHALGAALETLAARAAKGGEPPAELRRASLALLADFSRHRQEGADLVYEAYEADLGVAD